MKSVLCFTLTVLTITLAHQTVLRDDMVLQEDIVPQNDIVPQDDIVPQEDIVPMEELEIAAGVTNAKDNWRKAWAGEHSLRAFTTYEKKDGVLTKKALKDKLRWAENKDQIQYDDCMTKEKLRAEMKKAGKTDAQINTELSSDKYEKYLRLDYCLLRFNNPKTKSMLPAVSKATWETAVSKAFGANALAGSMDHPAANPCAKSGNPYECKTTTPATFPAGSFYDPDSDGGLGGAQFRAVSLTSLRKMLAMLTRMAGPKKKLYNPNGGCTAAGKGCVKCDQKVSNLLKGKFCKETSLEEANMYFMKEQFVEPLTLGGRRAVASIIGGGIPDYFISHNWQSPFARFVKSAETHFENVAKADGKSEDDTFYWVCTFANNQVSLQMSVKGQNPMTSSPFAYAILLPSLKGTVAFQDAATFSLNRVWCAFELQWTLQHGKSYTIIGGADGTALLSEDKAVGQLTKDHIDKLCNWKMRVVGTSCISDMFGIQNYVVDHPVCKAKGIKTTVKDKCGKARTFRPVTDDAKEEISGAKKVQGKWKCECGFSGFCTNSCNPNGPWKMDSCDPTCSGQGKPICMVPDEATGFACLESYLRETLVPKMRTFSNLPMKCGPAPKLKLADPCTACTPGELCMDSPKECTNNNKLTWLKPQNKCVEKGDAAAAGGGGAAQSRTEPPVESNAYPKNGGGTDSPVEWREWGHMKPTASSKAKQRKKSSRRV